jgi:hypothetical protein
VIPKDTCLSLFQGLGRILYKKGISIKKDFSKIRKCCCLVLDSEDKSTDENRKQPEVKEKEKNLIIKFLKYLRILLNNVIYQHRLLLGFYSKIILIFILQLMMLLKYVII